MTEDEARNLILRAGYQVRLREDGLWKVEGYAPMSAEELIQFATNLTTRAYR